MVHVHWLFILVQRWLLSNDFCKAYQHCLRPSFAIVHNAVRRHEFCFVVKTPANATMQRKQRQIGQKQI